MIYVFCLTAAFAFALGNILQKKGLHQTRIESNSLAQMVWATVKDLPWIAGISLSVIGTLAYYYAMGQWPISQVQAILALNPVITAILGIFILKETWDRSTIAGVVMVLIGVGLINIQHPVVESQVQGFFWPAALIFVAALLLLLMFAWFPGIFGRKGEVSKTSQYRQGEWLFSLMTGLGFGLSAVFYKVFSLSFSMDEPLSSLSGSSLVVGLLYVLTYVIGFFASQAALSFGRALFVVPFSAAIGTIVPLLAGMLLLGEGGNLFKWLGVLFISWALFLFVPRGDFANIHRT